MTTDQVQSLIDDLDLDRLEDVRYDVDGNPDSYNVRIANEHNPLTITVPADSPREAAEVVVSVPGDGTIGPPECSGEAYEPAHSPDGDAEEYVFRVGNVTAAEEEVEELEIN